MSRNAPTADSSGPAPRHGTVARTLKRESLLLVVAFAFGLLVLPFAIYLVGDRIFGEYEPGATPVSLAGDLWIALAQGRWSAWLLVASPYLVIQSIRATAGAWRFGKT